MDSIASPQNAGPRKSYFREVPWRWRDVVVGLAPDIAFRSEVVLLNLAAHSIDQPWFPWVSAGIMVAMGSVAGLIFSQWVGFAQTVGLIAWNGIFPLAIAVHRLKRWPRLPRLRAVFVEGLWALPATFFVVVTINLVSPLIARLVGETEMPMNPLEPVAGSPNRIERSVFVLMAIVMAPLVEELFYRGLLYNMLRTRLHWILAAPVQGLIFGLLHPFDLANSVAVAVIGMLLALFYEWRKTLLASIILHAFINGLAFLAITLGLTPSANAPVVGVTGVRHEGGCLITTVMPESAAALAGLQAGDVVTAVDGQPVVDIRTMSQIIRKKKVGDRVDIEFNRGGERSRADAVLKRRGPPP
jgi:membrane protease YdiL (CAAX protease family)